MRGEMSFLEPTLPPYDVHTWRAKPFPERMRMICEAWTTQGYGTPSVVYLLYIAKIAVLYVGGWLLFCALTPSLGSPFEILSWGFDPTAFHKAVLWTLAYEGLGFGCASGPLTGRYRPPLGGFLYFLRPGTTKSPLFPGLPLLGGTRRTWFDVALYAVHYGFIFRALLAPALTMELLLPTVVLLPLLGITDKVLYLSARAEHHYTALVVIAFAPQWIAGCKLVWVAIWVWAATSKVNRHFPYVVGVMLSNSPYMPVWLRKKLYVNPPDDLRPSRLAHAMAHSGTLVEYTFPVVLLLGDGGPLTIVGLVLMVGLHTFITSNMPMGVPIEWNVVMVYGAFFLFGHHATVGVLEIGAQPVVVAFLFLVLFVTPLVGNLVPSRVSFLVAMRYYAGNWGYSAWLFRGQSLEKLNKLVKSSPLIRDQIAKSIEDEDVREAVLSKVPSFRLMHLHGRALHELLPKAVDDIEQYEWVDGEIVAGLALGWNFGDGHLHDERLLAAIQDQCGFDEGELRCVFVESQPFGGKSMTWKIADATRGVIREGSVEVAPLCELQPWPETRSV